MRFRTFIIMCIYIVLAIILSIYVVFFYVDPEVQELIDSGTRIILNNQEEFNQALKTDGRIYALGEMEGSMKVSDISLDELEYGKNDKAKKIEKISNKLKGDYIYIDFFSEELSKKKVTEFKNGEYVDEIEIVGEPYAYLDFYVPSFSFYGYEFPNNENLMYSIYDSMETSLTTGNPKEHVISARYLPDKVPMWLDFTVRNGEIDMDSVEIHSTSSSFDLTAREASGNLSPILKVLAVFSISALLFGLTISFLKLFAGFKDGLSGFFARLKRKRGR